MTIEQAFKNLPLVGSKFQRKLPAWICNGEEVTVTVIKVFKDKFGIDNFNGHDVMGEYYDSKGNKHAGLFYLGEVEWQTPSKKTLDKA